MASRAAKSPEELLETYKEKRDFSKTPEPSGKKREKPGRRYVVQKHAATALHYDFRLELGGVLKSWAVTKGPSLDPADKRLAVRTEDHPLGYERFEGVIPEGYGKGTVMLWDQGSWEPQEDPHEGLEKGRLKIILHGERLKGGFALVKMKKASRGKRENWLLIKERDDHVDETTDPTRKWDESVTTGRGFEEIEAKGPRLGEEEEDDQGPLPAPRQPQLAALADAPPAGEGWLHEVKFDGYRIQALRSGPAVRLISRGGKDWTDKYPAIAAAMREVEAKRFAIDGELVALDEDERSRFGLLQNAGTDGARLAFYAFDLLEDGDEDVTRLPLSERKARLEKLLRGAPSSIRYSDHTEGKGGRVIEKACEMNLEGIISKKKNAAYKGGRGKDWIKSKCVGRDEFVIIGYRKSDKKGRPFSSLLLGEYEDGELRYRGRVGTGFSDDTLRMLHERLSGIERKTPAVKSLPADAKRGAVFTAPKLVAEIGYTERTADGILRHPSYLGLREDKPAEEVVNPKRKAEPGRPRKDAPGEVAGVRLTSPEKVLFDEQGATKEELAHYLAYIADRMLPFLDNRPVSLVRCPRGTTARCFFQKHHNDSTPDALGEVEIEEKSGKGLYLLVPNRTALVTCAQMGALELHGWGARKDDLERPDRMIFDLDPDEDLSFEDVREAAFEIRDVLASAGLKSFCLLTGGKGVHVTVPLTRRREWADVKRAGRGLAEKLAEAAPDRYVSVASKSARKGKIFIDWLRNDRGATAIVPYSVRARPRAPVAVPITWDELSRTDRADLYTLDNVKRRLSALKTDPWEGYDAVRQSVTNAFLEAVS